MIKLEATESEIQALMALIDVAVKSLGIRGAGHAVQWVQKLEAAIEKAKDTEAK